MEAQALQDVDQNSEAKSANLKLREAIAQMKSRMQTLENMAINISSDPAKAIQAISEPILQLVDAKTEHQEAELKDIHLQRLRKQKRVLELKEKIADTRFHSVNLRRELEEQEAEKANLIEDTQFFEKQLREQIH